MNRGVDRLTYKDHLAGIALGAAYVVLLGVTASNLGFARDEGFYFSAADSYVHWFDALAHDPAAALRSATVERFWSNNTEHPPLMKILFGLSAHLLHPAVFHEASTAYRFPGMLTAGILLYLLYLFGAQVFGRAAGMFAAVAYALLPQPFYHGHLDCFDVPTTMFWVLGTYAYWKALKSTGWGIATGIVWGFALAAKFTAFFLPLVLVPHYLALRARAFRRTTDPPGVALPPLPWAFVSMAIAGPLLFFALWPWMWFETAKRFGEYLAFMWNHPYYNIAYFGTTYFRPPFPVSYPFGMTLGTWPVVTTVLAILGLVLCAQRRWPRRWGGLGDLPDDRRTLLLLFLGFFVPYLVIAWPTTPIFGGVKHFMHGMPFLCLFAGAGFVAVARAARATIVPLAHRPAVLAFALATVLLAPAAVETVASHPFGLSHYTMALGGVPGAADLGMNRQFWGFTTGSLCPWLDENAPRGARVYFHDTAYEAYDMLKRDGRLRADIVFAPSIETSDIAILHHEDHFHEMEYEIWSAFGTATPATVVAHAGVPIITVYERPGLRGRAP